MVFKLLLKKKKKNHENYSIKNICVYSKSKRPESTNIQLPRQTLDKVPSWAMFLVVDLTLMYIWPQYDCPKI